MKNNLTLRGIFYKEHKETKTIVMISAVILLIYAAVFYTAWNFANPSLLILGFIPVFFAFITLGKFGGIPAGIVYIFLTLIQILSNRGDVEGFIYLIVIAIGFSYMSHIYFIIDAIAEKEREQELRGSQIDEETRANKKEIERIKKLIAANKGRIGNYRVLNSVAQKLTSTLERVEIVSVISKAIGEMTGSKSAKFTLLVKSDQSEMFIPAVEDGNPETIIRGTVKIYKKDPFDEWIIKNKQTLHIKDIDEDFRFKVLRKDWIRFKSMVAIPLIENENIIGILKFFSAEANTFDKEDVRMLGYLGDMCTAAVQNSLLYQKTKELAIRDGLTGLYMRRFFIEKLDDEIKRAKEKEDAFTFLMIDIDHFKDCNDTHGHPFGDKVLRMLGEFLKDNLRDVDVIGRYGGEEFAVLLPSTKANGGRFVAERLRESFSKYLIKINDTEGVKLTLSIGGIEYNKSIKLMDVINKADKALYYSKENGRNMVTFWEDIS